MKKQDISENLVNVAFLGIGSNLGNKKRNIEKAKFLLSQNSIKITKSSNIYESYSWPNKNHPKFYNIVVKIITKLNPINLLLIIKDIEKKLGRKKTLINRPRICDIDIIDYDQKNLNINNNNQQLIIPHPKLHERNFVLLPLYEISKNWFHPKKNKKIFDLLRDLGVNNLRSIKQL